MTRASLSRYIEVTPVKHTTFSVTTGVSRCTLAFHVAVCTQRPKGEAFCVQHREPTYAEHPCEYRLPFLIFNLCANHETYLLIVCPPSKS